MPDPPTLAARLLIAVAIAIAALISRRTPAQLPIAVGLSAALGLDILIPLLGLSARADLAAYLLTPAISAALALRVLGAARPAPMFAPFAIWAIAALVVGHAPAPDLWWTAAPVRAHLAATLVQAGAAITWWTSPARAELPQRCALVLAAGDVVGLLGPLRQGEPWAIVDWQAAILAGVLIGLQAHALAVARTK